MRIGFDVTKAVAPRDGIGRYTRELLGALVALEAPDLELVLYSLAEPLAKEALADLATGLDPTGERVQVGTTPRPTSAANASNVDLVVCNTWVLPVGFRGPSVFTVYDLTFLTHPACHTAENKIRCLTGLLEARLGDAVLTTISEATADALRDELGIPRDEVRVIHPAASEIFTSPADPQAARQRLAQRFGGAGLGLDLPFVLSVGTLEPRKNLPRLLKAWASLSEEQRASHQLILAGGTGWKLDAEDLSFGRPELAGVRHLGALEDADLADLYTLAELFVYPSLAEGFGLPVLEAMGCGAPVLASDVPAHVELTADTARLVDPLDAGALGAALGELLGGAEARHGLRQAGLERAGDFSWQTTARKTLELYRELI